MGTKIELNAENVYNYLMSIANHPHNTITYGKMEAKCGMAHGVKNMQYLTDVLNLTMMYNKMRNEPFLASLVINQEGMPGKGFFRTLEYLGIPVTNERDFHASEVQKVRKHNWKPFSWKL